MGGTAKYKNSSHRWLENRRWDFCCRFTRKEGMTMRKESKSWIWDPKAECMSDEERAKVQSERLITCVNRMYENVPYYRKRMQEKG